MRAWRTTTISLSAAAISAVLFIGCTADTEEPTPLPPAPEPSELEPGETADPVEGPVQPVGTPVTIASGLDAPWSIAFVTGGSALISERDTARIIERTADGELREVGGVAGVQPGGEGGLLGLATLDDGDETWLYAYFTSSSDNRIVRMPLEGEAGGLTLGAPEEVLTGLAKAGNHNGGRIGFGPDGMLYATVGDANRPELAQDLESLNGKILRMTPTGGVPGDNPFPGSLVYSLGHRNPQGIAWDGDGRLWASEFGQNTWDEFNRIQPGGNYGWPVVEGIADDPDFVNPEYQWSPAEASPSGLAHTLDTFFLASLRGERMWVLYDGDDIEAVPWFQGQYGRIRDVAVAPDGMLWVLTNNTDGRGEPLPDDDRIIQVQLAPLEEG